MFLCFYGVSYGEIEFSEITPFPEEVSESIEKDWEGQFSQMELSSDGKHSVFPYNVYRGHIILQLLNLDYFQPKICIDGRYFCNNEQYFHYVWNPKGDKMAYSGRGEEDNVEKLYVNHKLIKEFESGLNIIEIWFESCRDTEIPTAILENGNQWFQFMDGEMHPLSDSREFHTKSFPNFGCTKIETMDSGKQKLTLGDDAIVCDNVRLHDISGDNRKVAFLTETDEQFKIYELCEGKTYIYSVEGKSDNDLYCYYINNILHLRVSSHEKYRLLLMEDGKQNCITFSQGDVLSANFHSLDSGVILARNADNQLQAFIYNGNDVRVLPVNNSWTTYHLEPNSVFWYIWSDGKHEILVSEGKEIVKAKSLNCVHFNPEIGKFSYVCTNETNGKIYLHCNGKTLGPFKKVNPIFEVYDNWFTIVQDDKTEKYHFIFNGDLKTEAFDNVFKLETCYISNYYHTFGTKNKKWYKIEITLPSAKTLNRRK